MSKQTQIKDNKKADCTRQSNQSASETTNSQPKGNESMNSLALSFNDVTFNPVSQNDGQIWLTSTELAKALGYAETDSVSKIYSRNKDEFTSNMTTTVKMGVVRKTGKVTMSVRVFSLRGCHLLAMFAKTEVAKQFRKWVLDILDKEVGQPVLTKVEKTEPKAKTTTDERTPLRQAVTALVGKAKIKHDEAYRMVHQFMGVDSINQIPLEDLPKAVAYVHSLTLVANNSQSANQVDKELYGILHAAVSSHHQLHRMTKSLAVTLHVRDTIDYQLRSLREDIIRTVEFANKQNLYNKLGLPLVSHDARLNAWDGASWSIAVTA